MKKDDGAVKQLSGDVSSAENGTDVVSNVQFEGVQSYFVPIMLCTGRDWNRMQMLTRLEYKGVATSLSGVFPEERCKVDDDGGTGSFVGHERCGGMGCLGEFTRKCFREFWKEQGLRDRVLVLRETEKIRMSQDAEGPRHVTVEGFEDGRQHRKEQEKAQVQTSQARHVWSGHEFQRSERVRSKQERLGRGGMRRHGECRSACAGDRSSVVAREKSRDAVWSRTVCRSDCVRSSADEGLQTSEKLQVLFGSGCSKSEGQAPRERHRRAKSWWRCQRPSDTSHDVSFSCCYKGTQAGAYHEGCGTKLELESNGVFE